MNNPYLLWSKLRRRNLRQDFWVFGSTCRWAVGDGEGSSWRVYSENENVFTNYWSPENTFLPAFFLRGGVKGAEILFFSLILFVIVIWTFNLLGQIRQASNLSTQLNLVSWFFLFKKRNKTQKKEKKKKYKNM